MLISIKRTKLNEAEELWKIQKRSFEEENRKFRTVLPLWSILKANPEVTTNETRSK